MRISEYIFQRTDVIKTSQISDDDYNIINLKSDNWVFIYAGIKYSINWYSYKDHEKKITDLYKGFLANRLETKSPATVKTDISVVRTLLKLRFNPYLFNYGTELSNYFKKSKENFNSFKMFFKWMKTQNVELDYRSVFKRLKYDKPGVKNSFGHIAMREFEIKKSDQIRLIKFLYSTLETCKKDKLEFTEALIVLSSFELGIRPIQTISLNVGDFKVIKNMEAVFYSLDIVNVKKSNDQQHIRKRRAISSKLGFFLELLVTGKDSNEPLFKTKKRKRFTSPGISKVINCCLKEMLIDTSKFEGNTILRHSLAQTLADQGSPAEVIAEALGHNSTVAGRAYVNNTPNIAEIKSRALGKSDRFKEIIEILQTGRPKKKENVPEDRWISGVVGTGYIGGIGGCGLPSHSSCPKNPVYSCYTCQKFHPFENGPHTEVLKELQNEVQIFIDNSTDSGDLKFNRTLEQLEMVIESVAKTVNLFNK
ncbi:tyrosine-type recombinase/integrase [Marivirga harenae]|uniref:tyrosine-type recombinase/integrase n=1 Tax=Marivirga harenae TaxID=2010992 RepID=UPI0026E096EB|nr:tyrosine-type recombinase/integrase [Marivirga harenae]WKV11459.1 tyrosine-type recombinase/integrase [Marivirga harenae]